MISKTTIDFFKMPYYNVVDTIIKEEQYYVFQGKIYKKRYSRITFVGVGGTVIQISREDASINPYIVLCEEE